ncbi:conjugative transfer region protein, TIGR03750 family [Pseudomonas cedrina]|uniref:Conjugal transfer protein n=2 Tax=Pseudomonas cedrina TaxID=651740 RepID=A0A1V2K0C3_PSECE|nr:TIGR03750 family conjugal transfer protein [Pseudomonas cedrina]ONH50900.1 conjugal transfer protein [Pseudomonas cedrina subsp. cedrina]SDS62769.1 conjugative transfer region protein, TIGR03750 family [Pseudomonas cedrina]
MNSPLLTDHTLTFLPHRLNRQPVVVHGLTADELWACTGLSALVGLAVGAPIAWIARSVAIAPTTMLIAVAAGIYVGGGLLRRHKRGRPDTWLYRHLQWALCRRFPGLARYLDGAGLIFYSGAWGTRRSQP